MLLLLLVSAFVLNGQAQTVIENPYYEVKTGGIKYITKIELGKKETKVTVQTLFVPHWWIKIDDSTYIEIPETKERLYIQSVKGTEFNQETYMPESGDSTFLLTFPPISKKVKTIDFHSTETDVIYGISLDKKHPKRQTQSEIPAAIQSWMDEELARNYREPLSLEDLHTEKFFNSAQARLVGCIKGYDPRLGFETGIIYFSDEVRNESCPLVLPIQVDGRFELNLDLAHPEYLSFIINDKFISFYVEPGQTLGIALDWEEFLLADRYRNISYNFKETEFFGPLAKTNRDLAVVGNLLPMPNPYFVYNEGMNLPPEDFAKELRNQYKTYRENWKKYLSENTLDPKVQAIKEINIDYEFASRMFEYSMRKERDEEYEGTFPLSFYDFLQEMPFDNQLSFLSSQYSIVINRFEYMSVLSSSSAYSHYKSQPEKTLKEYFGEKNINLAEIETQIVDMQFKLMLSSQVDHETWNFLQNPDNSKIWNTFYEEHKEYIENYMASYIEPLEEYSEYDKLLNAYRQKDSILHNTLNLRNSMTYEIVKMRQLKNNFSSLKKEDATRFLGAFKKMLTVPYFKSVSNSIYAGVFPEEEKTAYELSQNDKGAEIFRRLMEPHKGKILYVDFWATTCGPCIYGIKENKELREKHKDHPDFDFVFITDESSTPEKDYAPFVAEHSLYNSYRISKDDMNYLMQLFRFSGIPHYVKVGKDGKILDDDYSMWMLTQDLKND